MRYVAEDEDGDWSLVGGDLPVLQDRIEAVQLAIENRLGLFLAEWFLAPDDGTPWLEKIVGANTESTRDIALKEIILGTTGVTELASYSSSLDTSTRVFTVQAVATSLYGPVPVLNIIELAIGLGIGGLGENPYGE